MVDQLYLALGWGYGHAAAQAIFLHLSFLPLTTSDGTWCVRPSVCASQCRVLWDECCLCSSWHLCCTAWPAG